MFTGTLTTGTPTFITGTYQRSSSGCTQGSLGSGTPDGDFVVTYFPDMVGTFNGDFDSPNVGTGTRTGETEVPATFVLTTNTDKTLGGTVLAPTLMNSDGSQASFVGIVTLQPGMIEGVSEQSGPSFELFRTDTSGTQLWVNAYATNSDVLLGAAIGEDGDTASRFRSR